MDLAAKLAEQPVSPHVAHLREMLDLVSADQLLRIVADLIADRDEETVPEIVEILETAADQIVALDGTYGLDDR